MHNRPFSQRDIARRGFTMIELLVAIIIIGILMALIVPTIGGFVASSRGSATTATIRVIDQIIKERADAIANLDLKAEARRFLSQDLDSSSASLTPAEAEFLIRKNLYRQALPQRVEDLWGLDQNFGTVGDNNPSFVNDRPKPAMPPFSSNDPFATAPAATDEYHSSEVLLWAITNVSSVRINANGKSFSVPTVDLDNIPDNCREDGNSNGVEELIDAWGRPLQFYTWSTRLIRPNGFDSSATPQLTDVTNQHFDAALTQVSGLQPPLPSNGFPITIANGPTQALDHPFNQDPHDRTGQLGPSMLQKNAIRFNIQGGSNNPLTAVPFNETNYHTWNTMHFPLLVSGSADGYSGLELPVAAGPERHAQPQVFAPSASSSLFDDLTDNITNRNSQQ